MRDARLGIKENLWQKDSGRKIWLESGNSRIPLQRMLKRELMPQKVAR